MFLPMTGGSLMVDESEVTKYKAAGWVLKKTGNKAATDRVLSSMVKEEGRGTKAAPQGEPTTPQRPVRARTTVDLPPGPHPESLTASLPNPGDDAPKEK